MARGKGRPSGRGKEKAARKQARPLRPLLLGAGIGLFWFVELREPPAATDAPVWGYAIMQAAQLFLALVVGWLAVSAVRLAHALGQLALTYLRSRRQEVIE